MCVCVCVCVVQPPRECASALQRAAAAQCSTRATADVRLSCAVCSTYMGALSTHNTGTLGTCMVPSEWTWPAHWSLHRTMAILAHLAGMAVPCHR